MPLNSGTARDIAAPPTKAGKGLRAVSRGPRDAGWRVRNAGWGDGGMRNAHRAAFVRGEAEKKKDRETNNRLPASMVEITRHLR